MSQKIFIFLLLVLNVSVFASSLNLGLHTIDANALKVRTGSSSQYKHSYNIYKNQTVTVHEFKNGWARISKSEDTPKWVYAKYLKKINKQEKSPKKKIQKKETGKTTVDSRLLRYISKSDNYIKHSKVFINVSQRLIASHVCRISDFRKTSGWIELSKDEIYFTYCGGFNKKDKIYINLLTNKIIGNMKKYK